ncbi:hypothetical protein D770_05480 [Flammeovirgaceae bacterium 311]|nr:hypothetical protein D770_05480 [Flammeovirgaceae bacterium 311]
MTIFLLLIYNSLPAQNFSGLQNKQLSKIQQLNTYVGTAGLEGKIEKVVVTGDWENKAALQIFYTGYENAFIQLRVLEANKEELKEVNKLTFDLSETESPLQLELLLSESMPETARKESYFLEIKLSKTRSSFTGIFYFFEFNKEWKKYINPENMVVEVKPRPIGTAASLKEEEKVIIPPRVIYPAIMQQVTLQPNATQVNSGNSGNRSIRVTPPPSNSVNRSVRVAPPPSNSGNRRAATVTTRREVPTLDGTWINKDPNTRSITKVIISNQGRTIRVFGKCSPKDCDWGEKPVSVVVAGSKYRAVYDQGSATSNLNLTLAQNSLSIQNNRTYKDNRAPLNETHTFQKNASPVLVAMPIHQVRHTGFNLALDKKEIDKGAQGPSNMGISLWEELRADVDFSYPTEITNVQLNIFPDKNPASGVYYYVPAQYNLGWNEDNGFKFRMLYGTATGSEAGNVRMAATLSPDISSKEIEFIKELLVAYLSHDPSQKLQTLRLLPLEETPQISFPAALHSQYEIPADKVSVNITSSIQDPIDVSWVSNPLIKEQMQVALLENVGIQGIMTLNPQSEDIPNQLIPVNIKLGDPYTLGRFNLRPNDWRKEKWQNKTPYPLKLKRLHMLLIEKEGNRATPFIYSWDLDGTEVPPKASVQFDDDLVPQWLDKTDKAKRIWIEYAVVNCEDCNNGVIQSITGGTTGSDVKNITFENFDVLQKTGARFLQIQVRSLQGDPKGKKLVEFPALRIGEDQKGFTTGPLYVPQGQLADFEYLLTLIMPDGQAVRADRWMKSPDLELYLGDYVLEQVFDNLPGTITENDADPTDPDDQ